MPSPRSCRALSHFIVQFLQITDVEITISWAVTFSCVMSSRLCLNVRGYVHEGLPLSFSFPKAPSTPATPESSGDRSGILSDFKLRRGARIAQVKANGGDAASGVQDGVELKELTALRMDGGPWQKWAEIGEFPRASEERY